MNIVAIVIGFVCASVITMLFKTRSLMIGVINCLAGIVGALAMSQFLVFGPMYWGLYLIPSIVGAIIATLISTFIVTRFVK